jgi:hypothetical protein
MRELSPVGLRRITGGTGHRPAFAGGLFSAPSAIPPGLVTAFWQVQQLPGGENNAWITVVG